MSLIHTTTLTDSQKEAVRALTDACRKAEPITLSAPSEDGLDYYLVYENAPETSELTAFSFLFFVPQDDAEPASVCTCEYTAFVHPDHRRQGHFTKMLNAALETADSFEREHNCQADFCFLTDEKSPAASAVLETIGAEYWYSEYKMVRELRKSDADYTANVQIRQADVPSGDRSGAGLYAASLNGEIIGSCALLPSSNEIYLYAFQIKEAYQSQGHGKDFLKGMLALIAQALSPSPGSASDTCGPTAAQTGTETKEQLFSAPGAVSVQVSGLNYIARNLYKKTGFRETESLSYYIY